MGSFLSKLFWIFILFLNLQGPLAIGQLGCRVTVRDPDRKA